MNKHLINNLFAEVGITINGPNSWDIQVIKQSFYDHVLYDQTIGLAKSFINNEWSCKNLPIMLNKYAQVNFMQYFGDSFIISNLKYVLFSVKKYLNQYCNYIMSPLLINFDSIEHDLYHNMLDPYLSYTNGLWTNSEINLNEAQVNSMEMICRNLEIRPHMKCLVIGSKYASFSTYLARIWSMKSYAYVNDIDYVKSIINNDNVIFIRINEIQAHHPYDRIIYLSDLDADLGPSEQLNELKKLLNRDGKLHHQYLGLNSTYQDPFIGYACSFLKINDIYNANSINNKNKYFYDAYKLNNTHYSKTICAWIENLDKNWGELLQIYNDKFIKLYYFYLNYFNALLTANKLIPMCIELSNN